MYEIIKDTVDKAIAALAAVSLFMYFLLILL